MKKIYIFFSVILPLLVSAQINKYQPLLSDNASWNIRIEGSCSIGSVIKEHSFILTNDTLINNMTYKKLEIPYVLVKLDEGYCSNTPTPGYKGAIREDTTLRKVFYIPNDSSAEEVLYDFNLSIGDTVKGLMVFPSYENDDAYIINAIDSILIDGNYHKRWKVGLKSHSNGISNIIEGVGLVEGFIAPIIPNKIAYDAPSSIIMCVSKNNKIIYSASSNNCAIITSINKRELSLSDVNIYPNPFNTSVDLNSEQLIYSLQLFNIKGQKIKEAKINAKTYQWELDVEAGVYFIKLIKHNGESAMKKLIKY